MKKLTYVLSTAIISATVSYGVFKLNSNSNTLNYTQSLQPAQAVRYTNNNALPTTGFTQAAEQSVNAVVHIKTKQSRQNFYNDPIQNFFFGNPYGNSPQVQESTGSGVIISGDGYIATNNHVIEGSDEIEVIMNNRKSYTAELIGRDPSTDLALLKIKESSLPYLLYGNSDEIKIGEWVLAVGNPFNLTSTVTAGIVSAKGRNINIIGSNSNQKIVPIESFIQTDAAVNPGNSGGALVSTSGELVGINTAIASNTGSFAGYSFAIPVNIVKKVMDDLLQYGEVQRALMGVSMRDVDSKLAEDLKFKNTNGVYIAGISEGSGAEDAGLQTGDVIVKIDEAKVNSSAELQELIAQHRPGDKVNVSVIRDAKEKIVNVILKNRNGNTNVLKRSVDKEELKALGASFENISDDDKKDLRIAHGLRVTKIEDGLLRNAGIKSGFIITSVDKKPIKSIDDLNIALKNKKGGMLIEGIYGNGMRAYYGFGI